MKYLFLIFLICVGISAADTAQTGTLLDRIDGYLVDQLRLKSRVGISAVIVQDGRIVSSVMSLK